MKKAIFAVLSLGVLLVASVAVAADGTTAAPAKAYSFYAGAGYSRFLESGAPSGSFCGQVGANYNVTPQLSVGVMAGYYVLGKTTITQTVSGSDSLTSTASVIPICAEGNYNIPSTSAFKPYVSAGAGIYINRAKLKDEVAGTSESGSTSKFGFNGGLGFEYAKPGSAMGYGLEARFHMIPKASETVDPTTGATSSQSAKMLSAIATIHFH